MKNNNSLYNPASQPKEWLIEYFVVRNKVFEMIFNDIKKGKMQYPEQHYIIQGQRGMGKTTLLLRLKYEIENTKTLSDWLMPVFFSEESYDVTSLSNLWEKLLKYLDEVWNTGGSLYEMTDKYIGNDDYEKLCFNILIDALKEKGKKVILFFDNFGELFLDTISERESQRFREILMTCAELRIIGASAVVMEDLNDYRKPFFDFFKTIRLEGLNKKETLHLIEKLQEKSESKVDLRKNKAKIETLAILTGGVIRTIIMLYEVLLTDEDGSALKDLEVILDKVTPLYKHRMDDLPIQQRKIVDVIAKNWDAISVKDISGKIRDNGKLLPSKVVSAQLQQLEKNNVIEKIQTTTKNNLYILKERFFNIWYLMRHGDRMDKCRVVWLTKFLEMWYSDDTGGIELFIAKHIERLKSGRYIESSAILIVDALLNSSKTKYIDQYKLLKETEKVISEETRKYLPKVNITALQKALSYFQDSNYTECINVLEKLVPKNDEVIKYLGFAHFLTNDYNNAINYLSTVYGDNNVINYPLGLSYLYTGDYFKAILYLERINIDGKKPYEALGRCYELINNREKAISTYEEAIENNQNEACQALARLYQKENNAVLAETYYKLGIQRGQKLCYSHLMTLYLEQDKPKKAISLAKKAKDDNYFDSSIEFYYGLSLFALDDSSIEAESIFESLLNDKDVTSNKSKYESILLLLTGLYFNNGHKKEFAVNYAKSLIETQAYEDVRVGVIILIWNNEFDKAMELASKNYLLNKSSDFTDTRNLQIVLLLLISKKQYHLTLKLFNTIDNLKHQFKPIYYALISLLKNEYLDEYLKMGEELKEPVADILQTIKEYEVKYA